MDFFQHTTNWIRGEIFEGRLIVLFGLLTIISAILFYITGTTPSAKAMLFPLLFVGIMFTSIGGTMLYSNQKRVTEYSNAYQEDKISFISSEKDRTATFIAWYPITRYIMAGLAIIGLGCFMFWTTPTGRAIGLGLLLMALGTFVVDHFSEERAETYHKEIIKAME